LKNLQRFHEILAELMKSFTELRGPGATGDEANKEEPKPEVKTEAA
jgi:hypothetical protein